MESFMELGTELKRNTLLKILNGDIQENIIHGAAVLAGTTDSVLFESGFGFADMDRTCPMNSNTVIDVASVTKVAACVTALLICHTRRLIDFDAPFQKYLPDFKAPLSDCVRVRDLANHTSGFGDVPGQTQRLYFDESGLKMLENMLIIPPPKPSRRKVEYACWNYILLAMIVEKITGERFPDFCRKEIFLPLKMNDSTIGLPSPEIPMERLAQTIQTKKRGEISDYIASRIYRDGGSTGNAGMFSSASDLGKLLRCYLRHGKTEDGFSLFDELSFGEITPDLAEHYDGYRRFGWVISDSFMCESEYGTSLQHSGWSGQTIFLNFKKNFYAVVLTTRMGDYDRAKKDRFEVIRQLYENI